MNDARKRLDVFLVDAGFCDTRAKASAAIKAGHVCVDGRVATRPAQMVLESSDIKFEGPASPYVSRGGLKLAHALNAFGLSPDNKIIIDIGASTGGFCDVLLQNGASQIYAVDVGHGQLHPSLVADDRIVNLEGVNARYLSREHIPLNAGALVCDASFISLRLVVEPALAFLTAPAWVILLIKPQFEVGKKGLGKKGVVSDPALQAQTCDAFAQWFSAVAPNWTQLGICESPITGPQGNREFLFAARLPG